MFLFEVVDRRDSTDEISDNGGGGLHGVGAYRRPPTFAALPHVNSLGETGTSSVKDGVVSSRKKYPVELRERAMRMFTEIGDQHESEWARHNADRQIYRGRQGRLDSGACNGVSSRSAPCWPSWA